MDEQLKTTAFLLVLGIIIAFSVGGYVVSRQGGNLIQGQAIESYILRDQLGNPVTVDSGIVKVGIITPISGDYRFIGKDAIEGFELAKERLETGALQGKDVRLAYKDSSCDPAIAKKAASSLIADGNDFVIALDCYGNTYAFNGMDPSTYAFTSDIADEMDNLFSAVGKGSISVIFVDNPQGWAYRNSVPHPLSTYAYQSGEAAFSGIAKKTADKNPDRVFIVAVTEDEVAHILRSLRGAGYYNEVLTNVPIDEEYINGIGAGRYDFENVIFTTDFDPRSKRATVIDFSAEISATYGHQPSTYAASAYDSLSILGRLISTYGKNPVAVRDGILALKNHEGVSGILTFNPSGLQRTYYVKKIADGKILPY